MDLIPKPDQVVSAVANVAHILFFGGLADLRPMPRTLIDDGTLREVYHYKPARGVAATGDPVLLVTPLAAPSTCFDLRRDCSLVEHLVLGGRPTYLVEYGEISFKDRSLGMEHWIDDVLPAAIREVSEHAGGRPVHLVGWSLGGLFALLTAADRSDLPIASVTALGSPVDVTLVPLVAPLRPLLNLTQGRGLVTRGYQAFGGVPKPLVGWAFQLASVQKLVTKPLAIGLNLDDTEFLAQLEAVDRFSAGMMAYPGRTFGQLYHRFVKANVLVDGSIDLGERTVSAGGRRGPGARLRRRDGRDRPAAVGAGGDAAPDGLARRPLRGRSRRSPRDAHRPRGADVDLAGARRVAGRVVRRDPGAAQAPREEGAGHEDAAKKAPEGARRGARRRHDRHQPGAPLRLGQLPLPVALSTGSRYVRRQLVRAASAATCRDPRRHR